MTFNISNLTPTQQKKAYSQLKRIFESDSKPEMAVAELLKTFALKDMRVIYDTADSDLPKGFAVWSKGRWNYTNLTGMLDQFRNIISNKFPEFASVDNGAKNAVSILKAKLAKGRTDIAEWDVSDFTVPLADGHRSIQFSDGQIIDTPMDCKMLTPLRVKESEIADQAAYDSSEFKKLLDMWFFEDQERADFLQMAIGQGLARNPAHVIVDFWGTGRNGKGAFFKFIKAMVGDYMVSPSTDYFTPGQSRHEAGLCPLEKARFAVIGEFEPGEKINTALLKDMTGDGEIPVSEKGGKPRTIISKAMPIIHGNSVLKVKDNSKGWDRRYKRLNFLNEIPPGKEIPDVEMKAIAEREKGIFTYWVLEGLRKFQVTNKGSFGSIPVIDRDTENVLAGNDEVKYIVQSFCEEAEFDLPDGDGVKVRELMKFANEDENIECSFAKTRTFAGALEESGYKLNRNHWSNTPILVGYVFKSDSRQIKAKSDAEKNKALPSADVIQIDQHRKSGVPEPKDPSTWQKNKKPESKPDSNSGSVAAKVLAELQGKSS